MERFPVIITVGAALLGWVAGDMAVTDPIDKPWVDLNAAFLHWGAPLACAVAVIVVGKWLAARKSAAVAAQAAARAGAAPAAAAGAGAHLRRVLLAVDGSAGALRAAQQLLKLRSDLRDGPALQVQLLNVQRPLSGDVTHFVPGASIEAHHHERGEASLAPARAVLDAAGLTHQGHQRVGDPGPTIAEVARELGCDMIVMGARGLGGSAAALLGSVAQSTIEHAGVPVLVVK
jgi:nucleotide-binding universal stress UspA family protein